MFQKTENQPVKVYNHLSTTIIIFTSPQNFMSLCILFVFHNAAQGGKKVFLVKMSAIKRMDSLWH